MCKCHQVNVIEKDGAFYGTCYTCGNVTSQGYTSFTAAYSGYKREFRK